MGRRFEPPHRGPGLPKDKTPCPGCGLRILRYFSQGVCSKCEAERKVASAIMAAMQLGLCGKLN